MREEKMKRIEEKKAPLAEKFFGHAWIIRHYKVFREKFKSTVQAQA